MDAEASTPPIRSPSAGCCRSPGRKATPMMMVDVLSGILLGLPFGKHVSSMYHDLSAGRELNAYRSEPGLFHHLNPHSVKISASPRKQCRCRRRASAKCFTPGRIAMLREMESEKRHRNRRRYLSILNFKCYLPAFLHHKDPSPVNTLLLSWAFTPRLVVDMSEPGRKRNLHQRAQRNRSAGSISHGRIAAETQHAGR